jgi:hypothetical protein
MYTAVEQEIIILKAALDLIDEMVNNEIFVGLQKTQDTNLLPNTRSHQKLFNILLLDFLSLPEQKLFDLPVPLKDAADSDKTYLFYIKHVSNNPQLCPSGANSIKTAVKEFSDWLDQDCLIENIYISLIDKEMNLRLKRISFLKICGNIAKHNFSRLSKDTKKIGDIFLANGIKLDEEERYLVLPEFFERFHDDLLNYHISTIAEFLNNIRWSIHEYLKPERNRSYTKDKTDHLKYSYIYPEGCSSNLAKSMYWDLMNSVRLSPIMPRFTVTRFLKLRY